MFIIEAQAIVELYPTYVRCLMNNLLRCHYCEFREAALQGKGNLHALVYRKQVRENNELNNHAEKILFVLSLITCYLLQFHTLRIFNNIYSDSVNIFMHLAG